MKPKRTTKSHLIKVRKQWAIKPVSKPHSTKKGVRGYDRKKFKNEEL